MRFPPTIRWFFGWALLLEAALAFGLESSNAPPAALQPGRTNALRLGDFLQAVLQRNESIHSRLLELEINQNRYRAERGIFEPDLVLSYDRVENNRENTAEQRRSSGVLVFEEMNNVYNAGIEGLVPTGARIRLGYLLRDLKNNLQEPPFGIITTNTAQGEFQTFVGVSLTQPLLKNAWYPATLANIRLAAVGSEVAYQEYRRQMMIVISTAEASYWNHFLAQEQVRFFRESVQLAEDLVLDADERVRAGLGAELELLEAFAGLSLRRSKLAEAEQKYFENVALLLTLMAEASTDLPIVVTAIDAPGRPEPIPAFLESGQAALESNPDYLSQLGRSKQENIRLAYARNQRLPQIDLRASYGLNGLGSDPASSWDDVQRRDYPSYAVGAELRIPLGGGIKGRHDVNVARLRKEQSLAGLKETETQILNAVDTALRKIRSAWEAARNYEQVVTFNETLLDSERARLEAGKVSSHRVLEVDASLFEARNAVVEARVQYERARLELELVQGTLLRSRNLDLSQLDLEQRTTALLKQAGVREERYRRRAELMRLQYERKTNPPHVPTGMDRSHYLESLRLLRETTAQEIGSPQPVR